MPVGIRQQRLITVLALSGPRPRSYLAGLLWPESSQRQAAGSVRTAVFKLRHELPGLLTDEIEPVSLCSGVRVDVHELRRRVDPELVDDAVDPGIEEMLAGVELLPGWYDDWVLYQQERWRSFRIAALEAMARQRLESGNPEGAVIAARHAAELEPLRERSQALLIRAQVLAGDPAAALRTHEHFRRRLWEEMGLHPSPRLKSELGEVLVSDDVRRPVALAKAPKSAAAVYLTRS
ncbi:AfsR/SARP family transcriptional regulator [Sinomonas susongensis]|uniref:AfsR/SARP family transcriptional regulator n=1 Tax=Sinomonas susongensis TaxID=1324851 RepID=UPI0014861C7D|nr:BTAD domain-containing putative transcriptional regulator [Sinomonas susongensis]